MTLPLTRMHGTRSMYVVGCKCSACTKANRDYMRDYMRTRRRLARRRREIEQRLDELEAAS